MAKRCSSNTAGTMSEFRICFNDQDLDEERQSSRIDTADEHRYDSDKMSLTKKREGVEELGSLESSSEIALRKEQDQYIRQLQTYYDNLLAKHALAEVTIDQLRLGPQMRCKMASSSASSVMVGSRPSLDGTSAYPTGSGRGLPWPFCLPELAGSTGIASSTLKSRQTSGICQPVGPGLIDSRASGAGAVDSLSSLPEVPDWLWPASSIGGLSACVKRGVVHTPSNSEIPPQIAGRYASSPHLFLAGAPGLSSLAGHSQVLQTPLKQGYSASLLSQGQHHISERPIGHSSAGHHRQVSNGSDTIKVGGISGPSQLQQIDLMVRLSCLNEALDGLCRRRCQNVSVSASPTASASGLASASASISASGLTGEAAQRLDSARDESNLAADSATLKYLMLEFAALKTDCVRLKQQADLRTMNPASGWSSCLPLCGLRFMRIHIINQ
ncbi:unnamed protein product [Protopolystoma xenopodis]|uniref:Uncharacterized protein n=1 Tax=Protopolystoma xenopodis TaxID=117903 RepID=A0A448XAS2_9PLAT|nr:unnamed protein product [Protopolystoma xenopodis]